MKTKTEKEIEEKIIMLNKRKDTLQRQHNDKEVNLTDGNK